MEEIKENIDNTDTQQRILVVDDEITILRLLKINLTRNGYNVKTAGNGREALEILEKDHDFDLVLLDIMMPEISGFQVCRTLREKYTLYELPIMFVTAKFQVHDIIEGFDIGANDYILKPFDFKELEARAKTLVKLKRLTQSNKRLTELRELTNNFHLMTVHDLKNPLTSILVRSEFVQMQLPEDSPLAEQLIGIAKSAHIMIDLINDFVEISKIESGKSVIKKNKVNLNNVVLQVIEHNQSYADSKEQELLFNPFPGNMEVLADLILVSRVVDNLIGNAIKFSPLKEAIEIKTELVENINNDSFVRFSVKDKGKGLSEEDKELMFSKFQKLSTRPTGGETSSGLGLAIAKELIEILGGKIGVESEIDLGSTFYFELPVSD